MRQFYYHFKSAIENIQLNQTMAFFSLISLSLTMMLFGLFLLFYYNMQGFVRSMRESVQFSIYLKDTPGKNSVDQIKEMLQTDTRILSFEFISKDQALKSFNKAFQDEGLIERLGSNPFPASFEVKVKPSYQDPKSLRSVADSFEDLKGVEEVQYGSEWLKNLVVFLKLLEIIGIAIGVFLATTVMTNIANTIRLHFYNRREEIETMKLIGATHRFIKIPFVLEGFLMGGISSGFSALFLFFVFRFSKENLSPMLGTIAFQQGLRFLPPNILLMLILAGSILGGIGSFISLNHLLRLRNPGHERTIQP
ncbi:MAG: cell division protein FtsX [Nitrospiria bacterium]